MDEDTSGDIDLKEFTQKITLNNLHSNSHKFRISEYRFIDYILNIWYDYRSNIKKEIITKIKQFDENKDGFMQFNEFTAIISKLEPKIEKNN